MKLGLIALALVVLGACEFQTGPFVPTHAKPCSWEGDCPEHYTCRFPRVDSYAVCMPGENELD